MRKVLMALMATAITFGTLPVFPSAPAEAKSSKVVHRGKKHKTKKHISRKHHKKRTAYARKKKQSC
jgi:accessory gene regulator protein AgrB